MTDDKFIFPPKFFEYEGKTVEDVGYFYQGPNGETIPILKVWEDGSPIGKEVLVTREMLEEIFEDKKMMEDQIKKSQMWQELKKVYGDALAETEGK